MISIQGQIDRVLIGLNKAEKAELTKEGYTELLKPDMYNHNHLWKAIEKKKYIYIDCGTSGAFMVEKETGEIFNIQGYGKPDKNKKLKADIGNIYTVAPEFLHSKRWNYLR